ncbi:R3H domain-containing nucleic acid-binding protein [Spiroplasma endosymbiont of Agriotes lineatus]|uniref:R3H domain-containing nucleic acid-binding protein n=1 Tax=Spiroplasma endosymbiont of Agriotes lineatus TaxID=3077930 RepID=UPI003BB1B655
MAKSTAKKVFLTKNDITLLQMPNNQQRIIHNELKKFDKVIIESQCSGNKRHIVIKISWKRWNLVINV